LLPVQQPTKVWNSRVKGGVLESFSWGFDGYWKDLRIEILKKKGKP
jgi:hypothetical protein